MGLQTDRRMRVARRKKSTRKGPRRGARSVKSNTNRRATKKMAGRRRQKTSKAQKARTRGRNRRRTRVRRGRGAACSRPRVDSAERIDTPGFRSVRVDSDATPETTEAQLMPEDLPLPPGAMRVPATNLNADLPSAIAAPAPPLTGEMASADAHATTNDTIPMATTIPPATKLNKRPKRGSIEMIMTFPEYRVLRVSPRRQEIEDALANYVHHPNYQDPFGVHPRGVDNQLWQLVMGWYSEGGSDPDAVDQLLRALRSPRNAVIAF